MSIEIPKRCDKPGRHPEHDSADWRYVSSYRQGEAPGASMGINCVAVGTRISKWGSPKVVMLCGSTFLAWRTAEAENVNGRRCYGCIQELQRWLRKWAKKTPGGSLRV